jgi:hypothetical protein
MPLFLLTGLILMELNVYLHRFMIKDCVGVVKMGKELATSQFFFHGDGARGFPIIGTGGIEVLMSSPNPLSAKRGLRVLNL